MTVTVNSGNVKLGGTSHYEPITPTSTYLLTDSDPSATDAIAIDLVALGVAVGDILMFQQAGDFDPTGGSSDSATGMSAVFSTSATLLASSNLQPRSWSGRRKSRNFWRAVAKLYNPACQRLCLDRYHPGFRSPVHRNRRRDHYSGPNWCGVPFCIAR